MKCTKVSTKESLQHLLLTTQEAAKFLNIHPDTVRHHAASGKLPAAKIGKQWRFVEKDLVEHLRSLYTDKASQGVINQRSKTLWHSTKEKASGGLTSVTKANEYAVALKLQSRQRRNGYTTR